MTGTASAQVLVAPSQPAQASLFCNLCAAQGCGCDSANQRCTNCGASLTAAPGPRGRSALTERRATADACMQAGGEYSRRSCTLN